jgi:hypothetical protein
MHLHLTRLLLCTCAVMTTAHAVDVEVRMKSGESGFGELIAQDDAKVSINRRLWTKNGIIAGTTDYPRNRIVEVIEVPSLTDLYRAKAAKAGEEYELQYSLARWCMERGLIDQAFTHAKGLYDRDPKDAVTLKLFDDIGYMLVDGTWIKESENAERHGLIAYDSTYLTPAEVDLRKAVAKAMLARDGAEGKIKLCENRIESEAKHVKDANARLAKTQADEARKAAERKKADDEYRRQAAKQKITLPPQEDKKPGEPPAIVNAKASVDNAMKAEQKAREDLKKAQEELAKCGSDLDAAKKALADHQAKAGTAPPAKAPDAAKPADAAKSDPAKAPPAK